MASSILHITVELADDPARAEKLYLDDASRPQAGVNKLATLLAAVAAKQIKGAVTVSLESATNRTHSSATATVTQASLVENDTVVVGGVTFTWEAAADPEVETEIDTGSDDDTAAANLAAAINAHSELQGVVTASVADNVVTISSVVPGAVGNQITLAETGNGVALSGAVLSGWSGSEQAAERQYVCGLSG